METKNIFQSITSIMQESIAIGKDKTNAQQGFKYRGIDDVMNTFFPLLSKHKIFIVPEVLEQTREERATKSGGNLIYSIMKVKYTFYAEDGTNISAVVIGEGMDSADKSSNKAMAVAMKYAMFQVFCIPTEEMTDPDAETHEPSIPKKDFTPKRESKQMQTFSVDSVDIQQALDNTTTKGKRYEELDFDQLEYILANSKSEYAKKCAELVIQYKKEELEEIAQRNEEMSFVDGDAPF